MVFRRKIYEKMKVWKELSHGESALMIEGARRIGKSTIVEAFAGNEYEDYILLDFAKVQDKYILYTKDLLFEDGVTYIPIYMAGLL